MIFIIFVHSQKHITIMASIIIYVRTSSDNPEVKVKIRVKVNTYYGDKLVTAHAPIGVEVPNKAWDNTKKAIKGMYLKKLSKECDNIANIRTRIIDRINAATPPNTESRKKMQPSILINTEWLTAVIMEYWAEKDAAIVKATKEREEAANRVTLNQFIDQYIADIESGDRLTDRGTIYTSGTIKSIKTSMIQFKEFQKHKRNKFDFDDIDLNFYKAYTTWLTTNKGYKPNSVGKCVKDLKSILNKAKDDGLHNNTSHQNKSFRVISDDVESIYLTQAELDTMEALDLSQKAKGYEIARDVFLLGCCIAQRVSDYTTIKEEDIRDEVSKHISEDNAIIEKRYHTVTIIQQKGNKKVIIPLNAMAMRIIDKYNRNIPYIWAQNLNENIKIVGRMAGITEPITHTFTKGGKKVTETFDKCNLITSHTARRTGATLMYLSGMDAYDICKITGHESIKMLRKYIKADELDAAQKMIQKYNYFE